MHWDRQLDVCEFQRETYGQFGADLNSNDNFGVWTGPKRVLQALSVLQKSTRLGGSALCEVRRSPCCIPHNVATHICAIFGLFVQHN